MSGIFIFLYSKISFNKCAYHVFLTKFQVNIMLGVDIIDVVNNKMDVTEKKYPVDKAKGFSTKYNKL